MSPTACISKCTYLGHSELVQGEDVKQVARPQQCDQVIMKVVLHDEDVIDMHMHEVIGCNITAATRDWEGNHFFQILRKQVVSYTSLE